MLTDEDVVEVTSQDGYQTLESIDELVVLEEDVVTKQGRFRIRAVSFGEMIKMREQAGGDEWEATKLMLTAGLIQPALETEDDAEKMGAYSPATIQALVEGISEISGFEEDDDEAGTASFSGGSPTG